MFALWTLAPQISICALLIPKQRLDNVQTCQLDPVATLEVCIAPSTVAESYSRMLSSCLNLLASPGIALHMFGSIRWAVYILLAVCAVNTDCAVHDMYSMAMHTLIGKHISHPCFPHLPCNVLHQSCSQSVTAFFWVCRTVCQQCYRLSSLSTGQRR